MSEFIPNYHRCLHKEIRNGVEFCHYHDSEIHATLEDYDKKIKYDERQKVLDEVIKRLEWRFDDTNRGRGVVGVLREEFNKLRVK